MGFRAALAVVVLAAVPGPALGQSPQVVAQLRFDEGVRLYEAGEHEAALRAFRGALELFPSPNARLYVARCHRELGRFAEAISEYHLTVREASDRAETDSRYAATRDAAEEEREAISDRVAWLTLRMSAPPGDLRVRIGGRELPAQALGLPLPVDPGSVVVRAEAVGYLPEVRELDLDAGQRRVVDIELRREDPSDSAAAGASGAGSRRVGLMVGTFTAAGLAVAAGTAFAVLAVLTQQRFDQLVDECGDSPCPPDYAARVDEGPRLQAGANAMAVVAGAFAVVAVVLAAVTPWGARGEQTAFGRRHRGTAGGAAPVLSLRPGQGGLSLQW